MSEKKKKIFPWGGPDLTDEEHEDSAIIESLLFVYGLGYSYSGKKFIIIFGADNSVTDEMSIKDTLLFLLSFEARFGNEIWFQRGFYKSRRKTLERRLQSGEAEQ